MKLVHIKLLLTAIFWGGTFIAGRAIADNVSPFSAAFIRFAIASVPLLFLLARMEKKHPIRQFNQFCYLLLLGLTGVFAYNLFFFKGLSLIHAGRASLIIANNPIFIAIFSFFLFKEVMNRTKIIGILMSVSGAIIAISRGNLKILFTENLGPGEFYIFLAVLSWVTYSIAGKRAMQDFSALEAVTYASVMGAILLLPAALAEGMVGDIGQYSLINWICLFYLGIFGTVLGFVWYYEGIELLGPSKAGLYINFVPIAAIVLAYLFLAEPITASLLVGAFLVSAGVYLTNKSKIDKTTSSHGKL